MYVLKCFNSNTQKVPLWLFVVGERCRLFNLFLFSVFFHPRFYGGNSDCLQSISHLKIDKRNILTFIFWGLSVFNGVDEGPPRFGPERIRSSDGPILHVVLSLPLNTRDVLSRERSPSLTSIRLVQDSKKGVNGWPIEYLVGKINFDSKRKTVNL